MASRNDVLRFLSEYRTKSVSQSFEDLLANAINIREGIRTIASTSQQNLREFLQSECDRDASFPPVLRRSDKDFLGGSFAGTQRTVHWMTSTYTCHWTEQTSSITSMAASPLTPF